MSGLLSLWSEGVVSLRDVDGNSVYVPNLPLPVFLFLPIIPFIFPSFPPPVISHFFTSSLFRTTHPNPHGLPHSIHIPFSLPWSQSRLTVTSPRLASPPPPSFIVVAFPRCCFLLRHLVTFPQLCHPASPPSRYLFSITLPHLSRSLPWLWSCVAFPLLSNLFSPAPFFKIRPVSVLCYIHKVLRRLHSSAPSLSSHPVYRSPSLPTTSCPSCLLQIDLYTSVQKTSGYECRTCVSEFKFSH